MRGDFSDHAGVLRYCTKRAPRSRAALLLPGCGAVVIDSYGAMRTIGSEYGE